MTRESFRAPHAEPVPDLQGGVREGAVRLSGCTLGNAPGRADHFEVERGTTLNRSLDRIESERVAGSTQERLTEEEAPRLSSPHTATLTLRIPALTQIECRRLGMQRLPVPI